jgi:EAL domain-containing protein (putative c-di-GMP-specific phosphodiesterase class I)
VVAEGVEDGAAWDRLAELECDELQGYFLARPIDGAQIPAWVDRHRRIGVRTPSTQA